MLKQLPLEFATTTADFFFFNVTRHSETYTQLSVGSLRKEPKRIRRVSTKGAHPDSRPNEGLASAEKEYQETKRRSFKVRRDPGAERCALPHPDARRTFLTPEPAAPLASPSRPAQDPGFCWQRTPLPSSQEQEGSPGAPLARAASRRKAASRELQKGWREPLTCADPAFGAAAAATAELREPPGRGGPGHRGGSRDFLGPASRRPRLRAPPPPAPPAPPPELGGGRAALERVPASAPGARRRAPRAAESSAAGFWLGEEEAVTFISFV